MAVPLLALIIDARDAVTLSLIFQFLVGLVVVPVISKIAWRKILVLLLGLSIFTVAGTLLLDFINLRVLELILALYILTYLGKERWLPNVKFGTDSPVTAFVSGSIGGICQGLLGAGGPNVVIYLKEVIPEKEAFRASVLFTVVFGNTLRLIISSELALFSDRVIDYALFAAPLFLLSLVVGSRLRKAISQERYHQIVNLVLFGSAIALLLAVIRA